MPHWSTARPVASTQLMIRVAAEHGVPEHVCLADTGLTPGQLHDPALDVEGRQELSVLRNILRALGPDVAFGLEAGQRYHVTTHGMWGFAMMSSTTPRSAVDVSMRYSELSYSFNRLGFEIAGREARFLYDDADNPDDLRAVLVERDIGALATFGRDLVGQLVPALSVQLRARKPHYAAAWEELFGFMPQFNAPRNCVAVDVSVLDMPTVAGDDFGLRVCEEQCRAQLEGRRLRSGVAGRVRSRILRKPGEFPNMMTVASEFGMSTRTLRNHLAREATSYRQLLEQIREQLAEELLSTSGLSVDEIASRLGYTDSSSFMVAFKRWKGVPPRGYTRIHSGV